MSDAASSSGGTAVPPGNCVTHGYHGRTYCPRCSTSAIPPPPLGQAPTAAQDRRDELEAAARRRTHFHVSPPIMFAASNAEGIGPVGECLCCGHLMKLAAWKDAPYSDVTHGVCAPCRDAALHLRGDCSTERGCLCGAMGETAARRERELRERAKKAAIALAREEARGDA